MEGNLIMARTALSTLYGRSQDRYLELVLAFPLRHIKTEQELDDATDVIDSLIDLEKLSGPEQDYLDVLTDLVEAYETEHYPDEPVSDADMLQHLLEIKGVSQAATAKGAGIAESTVSEVLSGKRALNRKQIGKLAKFFGVGTSAFEYAG